MSKIADENPPAPCVGGLSGPLIAALQGTLLSLVCSGVQAQIGDYDCVVQARSTIELQSAEEGILEHVLVDRGQQVTAGEIVANLESDQELLAAERARIRAESETGVDAARAQAAFRSTELERLADLLDSSSIPEREYATALVESRLAEISVETAVMEHAIAQVDHDQAKSRLQRRSIRSPVDGVVVDVTMSPGEYVHEQAIVMTIAELDPLHVEVFLPVAEYGTVTQGTTAEVRLEEPIGGVHAAEVAVVDNVFDPASRTFRVRLLLPNRDYRLPAGLRCTVGFGAGGGSAQ